MRGHVDEADRALARSDTRRHMFLHWPLSAFSAVSGSAVSGRAVSAALYAAIAERANCGAKLYPTFARILMRGKLLNQIR
jgi:hypothetical protein